MPANHAVENVLGTLGIALVCLTYQRAHQNIRRCALVNTAIPAADQVVQAKDYRWLASYK